MASTQPAAGIGTRVRSLWARLSPIPGGKALFSWTLGRMVPYTGTIMPHVVELRPGYARVEMRDRRRVRNHLRSIHAIALANLAEAASGLAVIVSLPDDVRGILVGISVEYVKKARGRLVAECSVEVPDASRPGTHEIPVTIRDGVGDVVVRARATWKLGRAADAAGRAANAAPSAPAVERSAPVGA